ncbi:MAG: polyprenyl synthetase family protein [Firmicutes bacterium]|nr:polyprenyl synthetase family protein [Bacillota bacterium]
MGTVPGLDEVKERLDRLLSVTGPMRNPSAYLGRSRGKLLRPALVLLSAALAGDVTEDAINAAVAVELIHTASLVHDDVVDESDSRRGFPSVRCVFGNKTAVLLGDHLFASAFELVIRSRKRSVVEVLCSAVKAMSSGELLNIENLFRTDLTEDDYYRYIGLKTASLMSASCEAGAAAAGNRPQSRRSLAAFGWNLGMAYQIMDDLSDLVADPAGGGAPSCSDLRSGVVTLPVIKLIAVGGWAERVAAMWHSGAPCRPDPGPLLEALSTYGCLSYALRAGKSYTGLAVKILSGFPDTPVLAALRAIVRAVEDRCPPASLEKPAQLEQATDDIESTRVAGRPLQ